VIFGLSNYVAQKISDSVVTKVINYGFKDKYYGPELNEKIMEWNQQTYSGQNQKPDAVALAVALVGTIWNLDGSKTAAIKRKASIAMDLMKLGTIASCATGLTYALLPVAIKEAIAYVVETPTDRRKRELFEWCNFQ
jgi:hypothetical protein